MLPEKLQECNLPEQPEGIILLFLDGVGLGLADPSRNPFARFANYFFHGHAGGSFRPPGILLETDAHMGVPGLPQSATGQTALFTGYNGPQILGRHITGFPSVSLRPYLYEKSVLKVLQEHGKPSTLLNSYSKVYLRRLERPRNERLMSASSLMQRATGQPFFTIEDYLAGRSLYMDLTNWFLRKNGYQIPLVSAKTNGRKLADLGKQYDFAVFEYFFTDKAGHAQSFAAAKRIIAHVDSFLEGLWENLDPTKQTVIVCTDHGNLEDLSTGTHTPNPVGTILYGKHADRFAGEIKALYDIPRAVYRVLGIPFDEGFVPKTELPAGSVSEEDELMNHTTEKALN